MTDESLLPVKVDCYIRPTVASATQPDLVRRPRPTPPRERDYESDSL